MKEYTIKTGRLNGERSYTMVIRRTDTMEQVAEYQLTEGMERKEVSAMRRTIDKHLDNGGTMGNYQW